MNGEQTDLKPELIKWLTKWKNDASRYGSKMEFVFRNALNSLKVWDQPIYSAKDCRKIKYFGEKLCERVAGQIKEHQTKNGIVPSTDEETEVPSARKEPKTKKSSKTQDKPSGQRNRDYIPKPRSGGYAILVALTLAEREGIPELSKSEVLERSQPYAAESMTKGKSGSHYTAFSSMSTLVKNGLVESEQRRHAFYRLTERGRQLGTKLMSYEEGGSSQSVFNPSSMFSSESDSESRASSVYSTSSACERFILLPGSFDVVLLVDTREQTSGVDSALKKTAIMSELLKHNIQAEMRVLSVGDFTWVARERNLHSASQSRSREVVLDVVIERKRLDDLIGSIRDGRFHEQKSRMKKCGVRKPTYLIEGLVRGDYSVPYRNLIVAMTDSLVVDGFNVKILDDQSETIQFLITTTKYLMDFFQDKTLRSCSHDEAVADDDEDGNDELVPIKFVKDSLPADNYLSFSEFDQVAKKVVNFTVSEMFIKHLLQFAGLSVAKAKAIVDMYPTVNHLLAAYDDCETEKQKEKLLANLKYGNALRNVGPVASKKIYSYYSATSFGPVEASCNGFTRTNGIFLHDDTDDDD